MDQRLLSYGLPKDIFAATMMLYKNKKEKSNLHVNADKMEYICFNHKGVISTLNSSSLKLVDQFSHFWSSVSSTQNDINTQIVNALYSIDWLSIIWKSDLSDKVNFFQAAVVSILLYGCTTRMLTKRIEKRLNSNCTRMLQDMWNKAWKQHPTKQQQCGFLSLISKTIQIRWTRHARHYWWSKNELIIDVLLWTTSRGRASVKRLKRTPIYNNSSVRTQDVV